MTTNQLNNNIIELITISFQSIIQQNNTNTQQRNYATLQELTNFKLPNNIGLNYNISFSDIHILYTISNIYTNNNLLTYYTIDDIISFIQLCYRLQNNYNDSINTKTIYINPLSEYCTLQLYTALYNKSNIDTITTWLLQCCIECNTQSTKLYNNVYITYESIEPLYILFNQYINNNNDTTTNITFQQYFDILQQHSENVLNLLDIENSDYDHYVHIDTVKAFTNNILNSMKQAIQYIGLHSIQHSNYNNSNGNSNNNKNSNSNTDIVVENCSRANTTQQPQQTITDKLKLLKTHRLNNKDKNSYLTVNIDNNNNNNDNSRPSTAKPNTLRRSTLREKQTTNNSNNNTHTKNNIVPLINIINLSGNSNIITTNNTINNLHKHDNTQHSNRQTVSSRQTDGYNTQHEQQQDIATEDNIDDVDIATVTSQPSTIRSNNVVPLLTLPLR